MLDVIRENISGYFFLTTFKPDAHQYDEEEINRFS